MQFFIRTCCSTKADLGEWPSKLRFWTSTIPFGFEVKVQPRYGRISLGSSHVNILCPLEAEKFDPYRFYCLKWGQTTFFFKGGVEFGQKHRNEFVYHFYPEASFGLRVLSLPASVRPSDSPSVTKFVCTITHHPIKLKSPKSDHKYKTLVKIPIVFGCDCPWPLRSNLTSKSKFTPFSVCEFVRTISHHWLKSGFPNLDQRCILALLRFPLILGLVDLDFQFYF